MRSADLHPGDRVTIDRKGFVYSATVEEVSPAGMVRVKDTAPKVTWYLVPARLVKQVVGVAG